MHWRQDRMYDGHSCPSHGQSLGHECPGYMNRSFASLLSGETITDAANGFDEVGGVAEFLAEGADVNVDRTFK